MSFLEDVIRSAAQIEQKLIELGARGSGIYELASSIRPRLGNELYVRIQSITTIRNRFAHESDYRFSGNEAEFLANCNFILNELTARRTKGPLKSITKPDTNASIKHERIGEAAMSYPNSNTWVEIESNGIRLNKYRSSSERRLVFYAGGCAQIKPLGDHRVPMTGVDAIGLVKLLPDHVSISSDGDIHTLEGLSVELDLVVTLAVIDAQATISRVALDAEAQQTLACNSVLKAAQAIVNELNHESIKIGWEGIAAKIHSKFLQDAETKDHSFRLVDVVIKSLKAKDADIRDHALRIEREKAKAIEIEHMKETLRIQTEIELDRRTRELAIERDDAEKKAEAERRAATARAEMASKPGGIWGIDPKMALELEKTKLAYAAEVEKARSNANEKYIRLIAQGAGVQAQLEVLKQITKTTHNVMLTSPLLDEPETGGGTPSQTEGDTAATDSSKPAAEDKN